MPIIGKEVQWGQDNSIEVAPVLTEEEQATLKNRMAAMDKLLASKQVAKYKIELFMNGKERGQNKPYSGMLSLWESGSRLHGGGDDKIYFCPSTKLGMGDCKGIIGGTSQGYGHLVCPACQKVWKGSQVDGEIVGKWTTQTWATVTLKYFMLLECNVDIYLKYMRYSLRAAAGTEQVKQQHGEKLEAVRTSRVKVIYPLRNLVKDSAAGSSIEARIRAFLAA